MHRRSLLLMAPLVLGLAFAGLWPTQAADSTDTVTFQCRLVQNGVPLNGTVNLGFTIWDNATDPLGGSIAWLHSESQTVNVVNGLLSVRLGEQSGNELGNTFFASASASRDRYIMVHIDPDEAKTPEEAWPTLLGSPVKLSAVAYSLDSDVAARLWDAGSSATKTVAQLTADYDARYVQSGGVGASQTIIGGQAVGADLILQSTTDSTRGSIILKDDVQVDMGLSVTGNLTITGTSTLTGNVQAQGDLSIQEGLTLGKVAELAHTPEPMTVSANHVAFYARDGKLYYKATSGSTELEVGSGAGGSAGGGNHLASGFRLSAGSYHSIWDFGITDKVYLIPFRSNETWTKDGGTTWTRHESSGPVTLTLSGLQQGRNYDVFVFWDTSLSPPALALELSTAWDANNTSRTDAVERIDGVMVKSAAHSRRYVGSIRATSATQTRDDRRYRYVWSYDNQVKRYLWHNHYYGYGHVISGGSYQEAGSNSHVELLIGLQQVIASTGDYLHDQGSTALPGYIYLGVRYGITGTLYTAGYPTRTETVSQVANAGSYSHFNNLNTVGQGAHYFTIMATTMSGYSVPVHLTDIMIEYWG